MNYNKLKDLSKLNEEEQIEAIKKPTKKVKRLALIEML